MTSQMREGFTALHQIEANMWSVVLQHKVADMVRIIRRYRSSQLGNTHTHTHTHTHTQRRVLGVSVGRDKVLLMFRFWLVFRVQVEQVFSPGVGWRMEPIRGRVRRVMPSEVVWSKITPLQLVTMAAVQTDIFIINIYLHHVCYMMTEVMARPEDGAYCPTMQCMRTWSLMSDWRHVLSRFLSEFIVFVCLFKSDDAHQLTFSVYTQNINMPELTKKLTFVCSPSAGKNTSSHYISGKERKKKLRRIESKKEKKKRKETWKIKIKNKCST